MDSLSDTRFREQTIETETFRGRVEYLPCLSREWNRGQLLQLIEHQRLVFTTDGKRYGHVMNHGANERVLLADEQGMRPLIESSQKGTGILQLHPFKDEVVIFGGPLGSVRGVYRMGKEITCIGALDRLEKVIRIQHQIFCIGRLEKRSQTRVILLPNGSSVELKNDCLVQAGQKDLCILERFGDLWFRYRMTATGVCEDFQPVLVAEDEQPVAYALWNDIHVLLFNHKDSTVLRRTQHGKQRVLHENVLNGLVEQMWISPQGNAIVWLLKDHDFLASTAVHCSLVLNGKALWSEQFSMHLQDIQWSPDGSQCIARIQETQADGAKRERIVTPKSTMLLNPNEKVCDMLVDNEGNIAGSLVDDGRWYRPTICHPNEEEETYHHHDVFPFATNLGRTRNKEVRFNVILGKNILNMIDEASAR